MENLRSLAKLCRVCLHESDGSDDSDDNRITFLSPPQIDKLVYIGDSTEVCIFTTMRPMVNAFNSLSRKSNEHKTCATFVARIKIARPEKWCPFLTVVFCGASFQIVRFNDDDRLGLCIKCELKLNWVYDYVVKFNSAKAKFREYVRYYPGEIYQVSNVHTATMDQDDSENEAAFMDIIKVEVRLDNRNFKS